MTNDDGHMRVTAYVGTRRVTVSGVSVETSVAEFTVAVITGDYA